MNAERQTCLRVICDDASAAAAPAVPASIDVGAGDRSSARR
jgi:hypothetical protein